MRVVYLDDTGIRYEEAEEHFAVAASWATQQCSSFVDYHVQDVSDVSLINDLVEEYRFNDPKDALMFQLKWKPS